MTLTHAINKSSTTAAMRTNSAGRNPPVNWSESGRLYERPPIRTARESGPHMFCRLVESELPLRCGRPRSYAGDDLPSERALPRRWGERLVEPDLSPVASREPHIRWHHTDDRGRRPLMSRCFPMVVGSPPSRFFQNP